MKALLLYPEQNFDLQAPLPWNAKALVQDLSLDTVLQAMACGDESIRDVALKALLNSSANTTATIQHRQGVVRDSLENREVVRELYGIVVEAIETKRKDWLGVWGTYPSSVLSGSLRTMELYVKVLRRLRDTALLHSQHFSSFGFLTLFDTLERELSDEYLAEIDAHLTTLKFKRGVPISAELGPGNAGRNLVLLKTRKDGRNWLTRLISTGAPAYSFHLADRDEAGARFLSDLRDRGIHLAANALAQSADHIDNFFQMLRIELAFYVGCVNLHEQLKILGEPICFPVPFLPGERRLRCNGLYDPGLALQMGRPVVDNTVNADGKNLVIITGANQGGKSSFLRSMGVAQLMMQCGMFVAAEMFEGELCTVLATHYKREEDKSMKSGKFDEELVRMNEIADHIASNAMVLFNESFAATNEREGSEIARQVVSALVEKGVKVFFVTHMHAFAHGFFEGAADRALFLRAERKQDGSRTYKLIEGEPLETSFGRDLYERIFAARV